MQKRGQAAMEFLMTYGWAILAAIIVIAVLAIYFRPGQFRPEGIIVSAPFGQGSGIVNNTYAILELKNNGGETYSNVNVTLSPTAPPGAVCSGEGGTGGSPWTIISWPAGVTNVTRFTCTGLQSGDSFTADIQIAYIRPGSTIRLTSAGQASFEVE